MIHHKKGGNFPQVSSGLINSIKLDRVFDNTDRDSPDLNESVVYKKLATDVGRKSVSSR